MKRDDALKLIGKCLPESAIVITANGLMVRQLYHFVDRHLNFYMVGSMGLCPTLAAGFSHCMKIPVIAIEGDGNALMGLSGFPVAAKVSSAAFVHLGKLCRSAGY